MRAAGSTHVGKSRAEFDEFANESNRRHVRDIAVKLAAAGLSPRSHDLEAAREIPDLLSSIGLEAYRP